MLKKKSVYQKILISILVAGILLTYSVKGIAQDQLSADETSNTTLIDQQVTKESTVPQVATSLLANTEITEITEITEATEASTEQAQPIDKAISTIIPLTPYSSIPVSDNDTLVAAIDNAKTSYPSVVTIDLQSNITLTGTIAIDSAVNIIFTGDKTISAATGTRHLVITASSTLNFSGLVSSGSMQGGTVLDGGGMPNTGGIQVSATCNLTGVTIQNCDNTTRGGGIYIDVSGNLIASQIFVNNNTATHGQDFAGSGGGIYARGPITLSNSIITNNTSMATIANTASPDYLKQYFSDGGGGICVSGLGNITTTTISGNKAPDGIGGGIFISDIAGSNENGLSITDCTISNNESLFGGGMYLSLIGPITTAPTLSNLTIQYNKAVDSIPVLKFGTGYGGGVMFSHATYTTGSNVNLIVSGSNISYNNATAAGGGIRVSDYKANSTEQNIFNNTIINNNVAGSTGGGISSPQYLHVDGGEISNNSAGTNGGGISGGTASAVEIIINNSKMNGNTANGSINAQNFAEGGGAIYFYGQNGAIGPHKLQITNSQMSDNKAPNGYGGGIAFSFLNPDDVTANLYVHETSYAFIQVDENSSFSNNSAKEGFAWDINTNAFLTSIRDISLTNIKTTAFTSPYSNAYNNYDIAFAIESFPVTFDSTGGTAVDTQNVVKGSNVIKPTDPTKQGYHFIGWYDAPTGGSLYDFSTILMDNGVPLFARWEENRYNLVVSAGEGGTATASPTGLLVKDTLVTLTASANEGYTFAGWTTTAGTVADATLTSTTLIMPESDVLITANFSKISPITPTPTPSIVPVPTETPTPSVSPTPSATPTPSVTSMPTMTPTPRPNGITKTGESDSNISYLITITAFLGVVVILVKRRIKQPQ